MDTLLGRYAAIRRRCAQTARISLHEPISFKEHGHKTHSTPEPLAYLPSCLQIVPQRPPATAPRHVRSAFPLLFRFGEGYLRRARSTRKGKKRLCRKKFAEAGNARNIWWLAQESLLWTRHCGNFLAGAASATGSQA